MSRNAFFNVDLEDTSELANIVEAMIEEAVDGYKEEISELKDKIAELEGDLHESEKNQCEC
jgi:Mg2+ and Co2+ transporter CorA